MGTVHVAGLGQGQFLLHLGEGTAEIRICASGKGQTGGAFSPTDLVAAALGACLLSVMEGLLTRWGYDSSAFSLKIEKEMADAPRRIAALSVTLMCPFPLEPLQMKKLERAMALCPVKRSLGEDIRIHLVWAHPPGDQNPLPA